jgi:hypothetical protein
MNTPMLDVLGYVSEKPLVRRTAARVLAGL